MNSNKLAVLLLLAKVQAAEDDAYDYTLHGAEWNINFPGCGDSNQSPINLLTMGTSRHQYGYYVYGANDDQGEKIYKNQVQATVLQNEVNADGGVELDEITNGKSAFQSEIASSVFGADTLFSAKSFEFHAGSEHTIDGVRQDLEMTTYHTPSEVKGDFLGAAVNVLFSNTTSTANLTEAEIIIIDTFFQSLQWDVEDQAVDPVVDLVSFGNLMELVDFNNRWAYKGSQTAPPCFTHIYQNVLSTVYPIKVEHVELFKKILKKTTTTGGQALDVVGNWRDLQEIDGHNVVYISGDQMAKRGVKNLFKSASQYLSVGAAVATAIVAATI